MNAGRARPPGVSPYLRLDGGRIGLMTLRRASDERRRILCFPFGGGSPQAFRGLATHLPETWTVWALDPPGHVRTQGEPLTDVGALCARYLDHLPPEILRDTVLLGHSLGGYVALAVAEALEARGAPAPAVVINAAEHPSRRERTNHLSRMDDQQLFDWIVNLGALPASRDEQQDLFNLFISAIRADILAYETFFTAGCRLERTPILVLGARYDEICPAEHILEWRSQFPGALVDFIPGAHLFLLSHPAELAARVQAFVDDPPRREHA